MMLLNTNRTNNEIILFIVSKLKLVYELFSLTGAELKNCNRRLTKSEFDRYLLQ